MSDGKTPEERQEEYTAKEKIKTNIAVKITEVKGLERRVFTWRKKKKLLNEVMELTAKL